MVGAVMGLHAIGTMIYEYAVNGNVYAIESFVTYLPVAALYILAMVLGYAGLRYIELSVSSPICNSSGAVSALLCFLVLKPGCRRCRGSFLHRARFFRSHRGCRGKRRKCQCQRKNNCQFPLHSTTSFGCTAASGCFRTPVFP